MIMNEMTDREIINSIINQALIGHLACSISDQPYVVPIAFGYDGTYIYFHSGPAGKKTDILKENPRVCLSFETSVEIAQDFESACNWSFHYSSVIADGHAEILTLLAEKSTALKCIMDHYSGKEWDFPEEKINKTSVWKIKLETITYKRSPRERESSEGS